MSILKSFLTLLMVVEILVISISLYIIFFFLGNEVFTYVHYNLYSYNNVYINLISNFNLTCLSKYKIDNFFFFFANIVPNNANSDSSPKMKQQMIPKQSSASNGNLTQRQKTSSSDILGFANKIQ